MTDSASHTSMGSHEVFISHSGIDMKKGFANCLHYALKVRGINSFLDLEELPEGEDVRKRMLESAASARIGLPIFTRNYGSSHWCLDELVEMMRNRQCKVIPVFFDAKPEDLRMKMKNGEFAQHFEDHLRTCEQLHEDGKIEQWKTALWEASWLQGIWLEKHGGLQGRLIEAIVEKIWNEIVGSLPVQREAVVSLDAKIHVVMERFRLAEKTTVYIVLLWGMGGIGKTTLARAIFNRHRNLFKEASFVESCGDKTASQIQDSLRRELLRDERNMGGDTARGGEFLNRGLRNTQVLIVLDDMKYNTAATLEDIIDPKSLCPGSRILVTSRDKEVFPRETDFSNIFRGDTYELQLMDKWKSWQLFCFHAFNGPIANPGFEELTKNVVEACKGLPLSLEVLGRHLRGKGIKKQWEEAIIKLRSNKYEGISGRLKISYESLDEEEQQMFQDVACFFIGKYEFSAKCYWECSGYCCETGLERLIKLCLVKVSRDKRLTMHDHLRDFGRDLSRSRSKMRVWNDEDLKQLLDLDDKQIFGKIRGLSNSIPCLDSSVLSKMPSLQLLFLAGTSLNSTCEELQHLKMKIRWLKMGNFRSQRLLLRQMPLEFLTVLEVSDDEIDVEFPSTLFRQLKSLRVLHVSGPCGGLEALPEDFGSLETLEELRANGLSSLTKLPSSLGQLKKLRVLDMSECPSLQALPESLGCLQCLEELRLTEFGLIKLPSSLVQLKKLRVLEISGCPSLQALPGSLGCLQCLEELRLTKCGLIKLPSSLGQLKKLRELDIRGCLKLDALPESFGCLEGLEELWTESSYLIAFGSSKEGLRAAGLKSLRELYKSYFRENLLHLRELYYTYRISTD